MKNLPLLSVVFLLVLVSVTSAQPARVLFLGENHNSVQDHSGQLEVLRSLEGERVVVAAEMFTERAALDLHAWNEQGKSITAELWKREWGHPYELYQELFDWLQGKAVLTHLRPDPKRTADLKEKGPMSPLSLLKEMLIGPEDYRQSLAEIFAAHLPPGKSVNQVQLNQYFLVQCFWDEYMAHRIEVLAKQYPEHKIVVLVGYGHLHPEWGIPARLRRRRPDLRSVNIAFDTRHNGLCDILWPVIQDAGGADKGYLPTDSLPQTTR